MATLKRVGPSPDKWRFTIVVVKEASPKLSDWLWELPVGSATSEIISRLEASLETHPEPYIEVGRPAGRRGINGRHSGIPKKVLGTGRRGKSQIPAASDEAAHVATGGLPMPAARQPGRHPDGHGEPASEPSGGIISDTASLVRSESDEDASDDEPSAEAIAFLRAMDAAG